MAVTGAEHALTESQRDWLDVRRYLLKHRHELAVSAAELYPDVPKVNGTPLLTAPEWVPPSPLPLDVIDLEFAADAGFRGVTGTGAAGAAVLPQRADGARYASYADAISDLAAPSVFENRATYRLLDATLVGQRGRLEFGRGTYFDGINTGEACAHEYAAARVHGAVTSQLRDAIGNPCDPRRRPTNVAISTLTLRHDRSTGETKFLLHWRDPAKVGHAGGLYQVVPVGIFQASGEATWNEQNDFDLWRCIVRELAEELRGDSENYDSERSPIDYDAWPFAASLTRALGDQVQVYYLGMGVDPLTFATDMLTVAVIDAPLFDAQFGDVVADNAEGRVLRGLDFTAENVHRFAHGEPTQAAGAALLSLAWEHRAELLR